MPSKWQCPPSSLLSSGHDTLVHVLFSRDCSWNKNRKPRLQEIAFVGWIPWKLCVSGITLRLCLGYSTVLGSDERSKGKSWVRPASQYRSAMQDNFTFPIVCFPNYKMVSVVINVCAWGSWSQVVGLFKSVQLWYIWT